jgi:HlyD family secretion protein
VLSWQTSGIVEQVDSALGERVAAGQSLVSLVRTSLPQNVILARAELINAKKDLQDLSDTNMALAQAENDLAKAEKLVEDLQRRLDNIDLPSSKGDIDSARASVTLAKDQMDKARKAYKPYENKPEDNLIRAVLLNRLAEAEQKYDATVRRLNNLLGTTPQSTITITEADLNLAKAQVIELNQKIKDLREGPDLDDIAAIQARIDAAQAILNLMNLEAPFEGTLTEVNVKPGDQVSPGTLALRIDDLSRLLVDVLVSEVDINRVEIGQEVMLTFDAITGKEYRGAVSQIDAIGESVQGVTEFTVTVELTDVDEFIRPGMTAAVNFIVEQIDDVLMVPNRAVRTQDGKRVVYTLVDDKLVAIEIVLGASSDTMSQVLRGDLKEGDLIVVNPPTDFESDGPPSFVR